MSERDSERSVHIHTIARKKCNHLPVSDIVGPPIVRHANQEQRPAPIRFLPSCPRALPFNKPELISKGAHQLLVKRKGPLKVCNPKKSMRNHRTPLAYT